MPGKHLTLRDRIEIEDRLREGENINTIARRIGMTWSSVAREIKTYRTTDTDRYLVQLDRNLCIWQDGCSITDLCSIECRKHCSICPHGCCNRICAKYEPMGMCPKLYKAPYVCNDCKHRLGRGCGFPYHFYDARAAAEESRWRKVDCRRGVNCSSGQLKEMVGVIKPLLRKGQSLEHIWQTHHGEFPVSFRTFYRYINLGVLEIINLELPKKVRYKERKKRIEAPFRTELIGKTYADFSRLPFEKQLSAVEMDCVCGKSRDEQAVLTLYFRRFCFQLMILLPAKTQQCVGLALDQVEMLCGKKAFKTHFGIILTDRGSEFLNAEILERGIEGDQRCQIYYCDPMKSGQKGGCEKNHVEIRKILPKGTSFDDLIPVELAHICSHVNSYTRPVLGGVSPYSLASTVLPKNLLSGLGVEFVKPDDVILKPMLFKELGLR